MLKKVKVCRYDVKKHKMEIVEEEIPVYTDPIKLHNPIEDITKELNKIEQELKQAVRIRTLTESVGDANFPKITSDNIYKLKFPSSVVSSIAIKIPPGVVRVSLRARVFGGHDSHHVKEPELKVFVNSQQIFQAQSNSVEGDFSLNKTVLSNGGNLRVVASNTGKYVYFPSSASFVAPYSSPSSPWLIYVSYTLKILQL